MLEIILDDVEIALGASSVLTNLSYRFSSGTVTALVGPSGVGKSTLISCIGRLMPIDGGEITALWDGEELRPSRYRELIAVSRSDLSLYGHLTAEENLRFFLAQRGIRVPSSVLKRLFKRVGLSEFSLKEQVQNFSPGMFGRLQLAFVIASRAPIWLLDDPGAGAGESGWAVFAREIMGAKDEGKIIIVAANERREAQIADAIIDLQEYRGLS